MPRKALEGLKAQVLKDAEPKEKAAIEAAFASFEELLDSTGRSAAALERIAAALEKPTVIERVGEISRETRRG